MGLRADAAGCVAVVFALWAMRACSTDLVLVAWTSLLFALTALRTLLGGLSILTAAPATLDQRSLGTEDRRISHLDFPVCWTFLPSNGVYCCNQSAQRSSENDLCRFRSHLIHRPTHEPVQDSTGEYPFSCRLQGRRRLWEVRFQLHFKKLPEGNLCFGLELGGFVKVSGVANQVQKALLRALRGIVGDFYHSLGDDPKKIKGELEPPTFVMPLWAFDQFVVSEPGQEPDTTADLSNMGVKRTELGVRAYAEAVSQMENSFSTDKVYTFCFWGISRFFDGARWEICGAPAMPGLRLNFNELCGQAPVYIAIYELASRAGHACYDRRHLASRKRYYLHMALWSSFSPPNREILDALLGSKARAMAEAAGDIRKKRERNCMLSDVLNCCTSRQDASGSSPVHRP